MEEIIESLAKCLTVGLGLYISEEKTQELLTHLKSKNLIWRSIDVPWRYPQTGDDQRSCPMLQAMFSIEHKKGIIIFIPQEGKPK